jgi:hypothetical protein
VFLANGVRTLRRRKRNLAHWEKGEPLEGVGDWDCASASLSCRGLLAPKSRSGPCRSVGGCVGGPSCR